MPFSGQNIAKTKPFGELMWESTSDSSFKPGFKGLQTQQTCRITYRYRHRTQDRDSTWNVNPAFSLIPGRETFARGLGWGRERLTFQVTANSSWLVVFIYHTVKRTSKRSRGWSFSPCPSPSLSTHLSLRCIKTTGDTFPGPETPTEASVHYGCYLGSGYENAGARIPSLAHACKTWEGGDGPEDVSNNSEVCWFSCQSLSLF